MGTIWENIKKLRKSAGLTQSDLAKRLDLNRATISKYETGDICPPLDVIRKICVALDCDFHDIVQSDPPRESTPESRHKIEELMGKEQGFLDGQLPTEKSETDKRIQRVKDAFDVMSQDGQEEVTQMVEVLSNIPKYQKKEGPSLSSLWGFDKRGEESAVDPQENDKDRP